MKIPDIFKPDDVEEKTNSLLKPSLKRIELEELILKEDSGFSNFVSQGILPAKYYFQLDESKMDRTAYANYGSAVIDIIKFKDKEYLIKNIDKVKRIAREHNSERLVQNLFALIKNEYLIFIYAESKNPEDYALGEDLDFKTQAVNFYNQRFGFEEVKDENP